MANPFQFGRAVDGDRFTDREAQLETVLACMRDGQNLILVSPRRYGKTSLLKVAARSLEAEGGHAAIVDLMLCSDRRMVAEEIRRAVIPLSRGWLRRRLSAWRALVERHVPMLQVSVEHDGYSTAFKPVPREYDWGEAVAGLVSLMAELGTREHPVALVIDEFQKITSIDAQLAGTFKGIVDRTQGLSLVFSGSRRHLMHELFTEDGAPLKGVGMTLALDVIPRDDMAMFLVKRSSVEGKQMPLEVAQTIFDAAHGVPNTVQLFAFWAFNEADGAIDDEAMQRGIALAVDSLAPELSVLFAAMSPVQQRVVLRIAREGTVLQPLAGDFLAAVDVQQPATVQKALRRLERDEVVWRTAAGWQLVNAAFERWLLESSAV